MSSTAGLPNNHPLMRDLAILTAEAAGVERGRTEDLWKGLGRSEGQTDKIRNLRYEGLGTGKVMKFIRGLGEDLKGSQ